MTKFYSLLFATLLIAPAAYVVLSKAAEIVA